MFEKLVLAKEVQEWLDRQPMIIGRKNLYRCPECHGVVVTKDTAKGVTPFSIMCRATQGCTGFMFSSFYRCDQSLVATFEWYRPEIIEDARNKEHLLKGGLLLRRLPKRKRSR